VLGGTQSLHTNSYDEALALPSEKSSTIALRTQQIIAHESGLKHAVDPLAGSYAVESMTNRIEADVLEMVEKIDARGGAVACLESGFIQKQIEESAYQQQKDVESREKIVVGVNDFKMEDTPRINLLRVSPDLEAKRKETLRAFRSKRDSSRVKGALDALHDAARGEKNLMPLVIDAVEARATLGEICDTLKKVFGTHDG